MTRAPWSPTGISLVTLLSPSAGAVLHALNYPRLGWPQRRRLALYSNLFSTFALGVLAPLVPIQRFFGLTVGIFLAAYFYKTQEARFARHRAAGGRRSSLVLPAFLLVLAASALGVLLSLSV